MKLKALLFLGLLILMPCVAHAQANISPLYPNAASSSLAVTASTAASTATAITPSPQVMVTNVGPSTAFIAFGTSAVAATTTSIPVPAGAIEVFTLDSNQGYVSAITSTTTAAVYFTGGRGN